MKQVLLMAHGWAYNHRFFNAFLKNLPMATADNTLLACLESGYFPEQAKAGLMIYRHGEWTWQAAETLHSLVLAHAELPWAGIGHSQGFSTLLGSSIRWHSMTSLHGFTRFTASGDNTEGTPARVLARMVQKAEQNLPLVLQDFHERCGHVPQWSSLDDHSLLADLRRLQSTDCTASLQQAIAQGTRLQAFASPGDRIVPLALAKASFESLLETQGSMLQQVDADHAGFAGRPGLYTGALELLFQPL
jgi:hypothetical protein